MIKTIKTVTRQDKERYVIPRRVQDVIPIQSVWVDGIFRVGNKFTNGHQRARRRDAEPMNL